MEALTRVSRLARPLARASLALCSIAVALSMLEAIGRVYVHVVHDPGWFRDGRDPRREPYQHSRYYSPAFMEEQSQAFQPLIAPAGTHILLQDFSGTYFNVAGGLRRTVGQPAHPSRRILVFGGSTIQSAEVPDAYTIPSFFQRWFNEACDTPSAVYNYGVAGMTAAQQLARLEDTAVQRDDIVIFYDGVNEIYVMLYVGTSSQLLESWSESEEESLFLQRLPPRMAEVGNSLRYGTAVSYLVFDRRKYREPGTLTDADTFRRNLDAMQDNYRRVLVDAHRYVESRGAHFLHVLQPHLFATPLSTAERRATARTHVPAGIEKAYRLGYPRLRAAANAARSEGVFTLDLSTVLAAEKVQGDVFFDFCHVNETGNDAVARALFAGARDRIGCRNLGYTSASAHRLAR